MTGRRLHTPHRLPDRLSRPAAGRCRLAVAVVLGVLLGAVGCKSRGGPVAGGGGGRGSDPLVAGPGRIPPQNVPVPDRGGVGRQRGDPLLGSPTGRPGDKMGSSYTDDPARWKGTFIPGTASTPAALAGRPKDDDELRIESPGSGEGRGPVTLQPVGGVLVRGETEPAGAEAELRELESFGLRRGDYSFTRGAGGEYVFQAKVPIGGDRLRGYTGVGPTPSAAARQVLDQVKSDRR